MTNPLRQALVDSHVAAVTIALLILFAGDDLFKAMWDPISRVAAFFAEAIAIWALPYMSIGLTRADRNRLTLDGIYIGRATVCVLGAWLISRWAYNLGPFRSLAKCRNESEMNAIEKRENA